MKINLKLNKIKLIPYQCKRLLNKGYSACMTPFYHGKTRYFFAFCLVEEFSLVVHGNGVILGLIVFYAIHLLLLMLFVL